MSGIYTGTQDYSLEYSQDDERLEAYSDASFADHRHDRKSTQGYIIKLFGGPIVFKSGKQRYGNNVVNRSRVVGPWPGRQGAAHLAKAMRILWPVATRESTDDQV